MLIAMTITRSRWLLAAVLLVAAPAFADIMPGPDVEPKASEKKKKAKPTKKREHKPRLIGITRNEPMEDVPGSSNGLAEPKEVGKVREPDPSEPPGRRPPPEPQQKPQPDKKKAEHGGPPTP